MRTGPVKRRHHVAPRTYLLGFADENNLVRVRRRNGDDKTLKINNVAVRNNFYNFRTSDGTEHSDVEDWLGSHIEGPVAPILGRLRAGEQPTYVDITVLARFVAAQLLRSPTVASYLQQIDSTLGPVLLASAVLDKRGLTRATATRADLELIEKVTRRAWAARDKSSEPNSRLRTILRSIDDISRDLANWHWAVLSAEESCLITSDAPAVTIQPGAGWAGILPSGSPVLLPLSPTHLLVGEKHVLGTQTTLQTELAELVCRTIANETDDVVICHPQQLWPCDLSLPAQRPQLPNPTVRWYKPGEADPTPPVGYPSADDEDIRRLLAHLEPEDPDLS